MIISPGSTSRTKLAPSKSKAQVSLATIYPPSFSLPMLSGRTPYASRTAKTFLRLIISRQYAPFISFRASIILSFSFGAELFAIRWSMFSVSILL